MDKQYIKTLLKEIENELNSDDKPVIPIIDTTSTPLPLNNSLRDNIVEEALKYVGNPYKWGGNSLTEGCDCSGYVKLIFEKFNINLPRVSRDQALVGKTVSQPRKGDLIFYTNSDGVVNHVALYIGGGKIVNAAGDKYGIQVRDNYQYRQVKVIKDVIGD